MVLCNIMDWTDYGYTVHLWKDFHNLKASVLVTPSLIGAKRARSRIYDLIDLRTLVSTVR